MQGFREIEVWARTHGVTLATCRARERLPVIDRFGLTGPMRRAAASISANIAEGWVRSTDADFARFLHMALGSASELEYFLRLACDLALLDKGVRTN